METIRPSPVDRAIAAVGSATALAQQLGVTSAAVGQWKSGERRVPAERCPEIERATLGVVRCEELRPDVAWEVLRPSVASTGTKTPNAPEGDKALPGEVGIGLDSVAGAPCA